MSLFTVIIAIAFIQVWGSENPLHKDTWYFRWIDWVSQKLPASLHSLQGLICVLCPVLACGLVIALFYQLTAWLALPLGVIILLYSFGRGEFSELVDTYIKACSDQDWDVGLARANILGVDTSGLTEGDWMLLHQKVLESAAYRGFERMFAVLFWFFLLGPLAALLYRLLILYLIKRQNGNNKDNLLAAKALWLFEWPAVRVFGLSLSFTGNFVGCYNRWMRNLTDLTASTAEYLGEIVYGALSVDEELKQNCDVTRKELSLLHKLFARTLWFWLSIAALVTLLV